MLVLTGATICLSVYLYIVIPKGFFPQQDTGLMAGNILGSQDTSFPVMQEKLKQYTDIVMSDPAVKSMAANTGGGAENTGRMQIELKPIGERKVTVDQVIARLRRKLAVVPGRHAVPAGLSRHHGRRADQQFAIPIHALERKSHRPAAMGASRRSQDEAVAPVARYRQRSADARFAGHSGD